MFDVMTVNPGDSLIFQVPNGFKVTSELRDHLSQSLPKDCKFIFISSDIGVILVRAGKSEKMEG